MASSISLSLFPTGPSSPERLSVTLDPVADSALTEQQSITIVCSKPEAETLRMSVYCVYDSGQSVVIYSTNTITSAREFDVEQSATLTTITLIVTPKDKWLGPFTLFVATASDEGRISSVSGSGLGDFIAAYDAPLAYTDSSGNEGQFGSVAFTSKDLLDDIKRRTFAPEDQTTFTDAEMLDIAWKEMVGVIYPKLIAARADFFSTTIKMTPNSANRIRLPGDVVGGRIYEIKIGNGDQERSINQVSPHDAYGNQVEGFWIENGDIVFTQSTSLEGAAYIRYPLRPGRFQLPSETSLRIAATSGAMGEIACSTAITDTLQATNPDTGNASIIDVQLGSSPHTIIPTNVRYSTLDDAGSVGIVKADCNAARQEFIERTQFQEGDMVVVGGTCWFVPLPTDCCDWLVQRTALRILEYMNKAEAVAALQQKLSDIERDIASLYAPRSSGNPKTISGNSLLGYY